MAACGGVGMSSESNSNHWSCILLPRLMVALVTELAPKCSINFETVIRLQFLLSWLVYECLLTSILAVLRRCIFPCCGVTCDG